jgi:hypothetical protein
LILSYVRCGTTFFWTNSSFRFYGRPSTIFFA